MWKKLKRIFLNILGDIKVYRFPMFIVYDPSTFLIKGYHTRMALNMLEPGDVVMRTYSNYLDGFFIPGTYSHSSVYIGDGIIIHAIAEGVQTIDAIDFLRCDGFVILRPKNKEMAEQAVLMAHSFIGTPYDFDFTDGTDALYCHELTATCYKALGIEKKEVRILGVECAPRYTCDSFLENEGFTKIAEVNPKTGAYFIAGG